MSLSSAAAENAASASSFKQWNLSFESVTLGNVENVVITKQGDFLYFAGLIIFLFDHLKEDCDMGFLTPSDVPTQILNLFV
jgi:hypothetical protein